jgi:hypothetical protein
MAPEVDKDAVIDSHRYSNIDSEPFRAPGETLLQSSFHV